MADAAAAPEAAPAADAAAPPADDAGSGEEGEEVEEVYVPTPEEKGGEPACARRAPCGTLAVATERRE